MKQEVFFEEWSAKKFIRELQDKGANFQVNYEDYWDGKTRIPCIVIDYVL